MQLLIMCVSGSARWSATNLMNLAGMISRPVEQSERNDFIHLSTSPWGAGLRLKGVATDESTPARLSTRHSMSSKDTAFDPAVLSAVVLKCLFSSSGSIRRGLGLGFKIL